MEQKRDHSRKRNRLTIAMIGARGFPADFPGMSGVDVYIEQLALQLRKKINITVFVRSWAPIRRNQRDGISLIRVPTIRSKFLDTPLYALIATILSCFSDAKVLVFHTTGATLFLWLPKIIGKEVYVALHSVEWKRKKWGFFSETFLRFLEWVSIHLANRLFVVSDTLGKYVQQTYSKQAIVLPAGLSLRRALVPDEITKRVGLNGSDYILFLGRFVPEKRIEWLLEAYQSLSKRKPIKLVLAGERTHNSYEQTLEKRAFSIFPQVVWTGFVRGKLKEELLSNCAVLVIPSSLEGAPIAMFEALSYRRRVVIGADFVDESLKKRFPDKLFVFENSSQKSFKRSVESALTGESGNHRPNQQELVNGLSWKRTANILSSYLKRDMM